MYEHLLRRRLLIFRNKRDIMKRNLDTRSTQFYLVLQLQSQVHHGHRQRKQQELELSKGQFRLNSENSLTFCDPYRSYVIQLNRSTDFGV